MHTILQENALADGNHFVALVISKSLNTISNRHASICSMHGRIFWFYKYQLLMSVCFTLQLNHQYRQRVRVYWQTPNDKYLKNYFCFLKSLTFCDFHNFEFYNRERIWDIEWTITLYVTLATTSVINTHEIHQLETLKVIMITFLQLLLSPWFGTLEICNMCSPRDQQYWVNLELESLIPKMTLIIAKYKHISKRKTSRQTLISFNFITEHLTLLIIVISWNSL